MQEIKKHSPAEGWAGAAPQWLLMGALLVVYVILASSSTLFDRDEPRFSRAAVEMAGSGNLLVPTLNMALRPDKPPMIYWLMQGPLQVLGPTELAVRLPSIVGMLISVWLVGLLAVRFFGSGVRLGAMVIMGTALLPIYIGTAATADGTLIACILLAQLGVAGLWLDGVRWRYLLLFFIGITLGQLTKGPVALAVPLLTLVGASVAWRVMIARGAESAAHSPVIRLPWWRLLGLTALSGLVFLAWFIPADLAVGGEMWRQMVGRHLIERMIRPAEGHGGSGPWGYLLLLPLYLPLLVGLVFPWTMHLPAAVSALWRGHLGDARQRALLWGWIVPNLVIFSLVATKLPHYVLPIVPALVLAMVGMLQAHQQGRMSLRDRDWLRGGIWFFGPVTVGFAVVLLAGCWWISPAMGQAAIVPAAVLLVVAVIAMRLQLREAVGRVSRLLAVGSMACVVLLAVMVVPIMEGRIKPAQELAGLVHADQRSLNIEHSLVDVYWSGYGEPSFLFYLNLPHDQAVQSLGRDPEGWQAWLAEPGTAYLIITTERHDALMAMPEARESLFVVGRESMLNYASGGQRHDLLVVRRDSSGLP